MGRMQIFCIAVLTGFFFRPDLFSEAADDSASKRIIIKFTESGALLNEAVHYFQDGISKAVKKGSADKTPLLHDFLSETQIDQIMPLRDRKCFSKTARGLERLFLATVSNSINNEYIINYLHSRDDIEYAEPDYIGRGEGREYKAGLSELNKANEQFPDDQHFRLQWGLKNTGQDMGGVTGAAGADINVSGAWKITEGSSDIILAVLDSGIPKDHPEFSGRLIAGYDFVNNDNDPADDHGHGTSVASIAAATGNNSGLMAGVDWNAQIMPVKVLNQNNSGLYSWWINGIEYAADHGADVINMSVGGTGYSQALQDAVNYALDKGAIIVACMMNSNDDTVYYPAGFEGVISVGAINNRDVRAVSFFWDKENSGSNYGDHIDFAAPGDMILSLHHQSHFLVSWWSGTSQAAPMVSGTITLMLGVNKEMGRDDIYDALKSTTRDKVRKPAGQTAWNRYYGWGRIDSGAAVRKAANLEEDTPIKLPGGYRLLQNYPNPFNASTVIQYTLSTKSHVILTVYDTAGRRRAVLVNQMQDAGVYEAAFDGSGLAGGVYLCRIQAGEYSKSIKMLLLK